MIRIRIQHFGLNTDPDSGPIEIRVLMAKYWKNLQPKKIFLVGQKLRFTYPYASIKDAHFYKRSFQPSEENIQHMKLLNFFLLLWVIFVLLDPDADPLTLLNTDHIRIRNTENIVQVPTGSGKCQRGRPPSPRRGRRGGQGQRPVRRQRRDRRFAVLRWQRRDWRFSARLPPELRL